MATLTFGTPRPVGFGPPVYYPPQPVSPATTGELIFIGVIVLIIFIIFIWAAVTGNIQYTESPPRPIYPYPYTYPYYKTQMPKVHNLPIHHKSHFESQNQKIPSEFTNSFPFGDDYNPQLFSSGC